jgi:thymidine kinase
MFIEPHFHFGQEGASRVGGWIEIITGCMFSGKTEELIRRLKRAQLAKQQVAIFKPVVDTRYHLENIVSHDHNSIPSIPVSNPKEIVLLAVDCEVVGIDEAQFFNESLVEVASFLANQGKRVIVAGLDMDFEGEPFGPIPRLMAVSEFVTKVHAICMQCGSVASYSYRLSTNKETVLLGEKDFYEARCRKCFTEGQLSHVPEDYQS